MNDCHPTSHFRLAANICCAVIGQFIHNPSRHSCLCKTAMFTPCDKSDNGFIQIAFPMRLLQLPNNSTRF